jgi:hypothetical protein
MRRDDELKRFVCGAGRKCRKTLAYRMPYASGHCDARSFLVVMFGVYLFAVEGKYVAQAAGLRENSVSSTLQMIEQAATQFHEFECAQLQPYDELQVDEVCFGSRKYQRGKRTNEGGTLLSPSSRVIATARRRR